jgi:hypothetical protein
MPCPISPKTVRALCLPATAILIEPAIDEPVLPNTPAPAAMSPGCGDKDSRRGDQGRHDERHAGSKRETGGRRQRGLDRTGFQGRGEAEFLPGMRAEGVVGHKLVGDLLCEPGSRPRPT